MDMTVYFVFAAFALAAEAVLASVMIFAPSAGSGRRRLLIKCVCSGWFILTGIASAAFSGVFSAYALFVLLGLTASFWGDFFLQLEDQEKYFHLSFFSYIDASNPIPCGAATHFNLIVINFINYFNYLNLGSFS